MRNGGWGQFCPQETFHNIWIHIWLSQFGGERLLLASSGPKSEVFLNILYCQGQPPKQLAGELKLLLWLTAFQQTFSINLWSDYYGKNLGMLKLN